MCGIFGYIGKQNPVHHCLEGLKKLEYRGYDSAGIAGIYDKNLVLCKSSGKIANLEKNVVKKKLKLDLAIGHTRWATHGPTTNLNAHPHEDHTSSIAVVHNGIIENYSSLKSQLKNKNISFKSETDTEVIAQLISYNYKGNLLLTLFESLKMLKGSFAIALIHKNYPGKIIAATKASPLAIGYDDLKTKVLISSDPNAFLGHDLNIFYLCNDELAIIGNSSIEVYNKNKVQITKKTEKLEGVNTPPSKEGFEHYMLKEIYEQPISIQNVVLEHILEEFGTAKFQINFSKNSLMAIRNILIVACGTSWHAASIAAAMLEEKARIPSHAEIASEIRFKNPIISEDTLVIAISQSGETADTIAALREIKAKGAKTLAICNVKNSTLTREADSSILLKAGPEISVCSTKAFTSQLTVLILFTLFMARLRHLDKKEGQKLLKEIKKIPKFIKYVLNKSLEIQKIAVKYSKYENFFFLGRRYMHPTCLEAALKLKEISYLNANGYAAGELKHGPISLISEKLPVIAFCNNSQTYDKMLNNLMEVKARGAPVLALAPIGDKEIKKIADDVISLPFTTDEISIFPTSVAGQLFAYFIAKEKKTEIDQPRNLAKSVTVE